MLRIVWSGVHEQRKCLGLLLQALACVKLSVDVRLDVCGEGKMTRRWQRLATRLGLADRIVWHGWLPKDRAQAVVAQCDVFVITSIRDLTSTVLLEALSAGKPVVCLDHCGFADVVDETCGIKVPVGTPSEVIAGFAAALVRLRDDALRAKLSAGARQRAAAYAWSRKRAALERIYRSDWRRVCVGVFSCSPLRGSEPGMGWNFLREIAATGREIWAITNDEFPDEIRAYAAELPNVHFMFVPEPAKRLRGVLRKAWPPSYYWFYRWWQRRAFRIAQELHAQYAFDVVHQLNMAGFREPGFLWKLSVPFVWGPIGGLDLTDGRLLGLLDAHGKAEFFCRNVINWVQRRFLVRPRRAAHRAAESNALICATGENARLARRLWGVGSTVICEVGAEG